MSTALIIAIAVVIVISYVAFKGAQDAMERNSRRGDWAIFVVRWVIGQHWTGRPQTNAGFKRKGTKALTQTGYAMPFYFKPRWYRMLRRNLFTFGPFALLYGALTDWKTTAALFALAMLVWAGYGVWRLSQAISRRRHKRDWLAPLHEATAPLANVPLSAKPSSWIDVETDRSRAVFRLPEGFNLTETQQERFVQIAAKRLGMESPEVDAKLSGKEPTLTLTASTMPKDMVRLRDVIQAITEAPIDTLILGLGRQRQPVDVSLHEDSPHLGASMGAGAGKSTLARLVSAQALHKGAIVVILDIKKVSHPWARGLPNVSYCDTPELIHNALIWLTGELDRRNEVALYSTDYEGSVNANVGARILIIAEELNLTANKLRSYWKDELNGQGQSPALMALQDIAFAGRQVRMNIFFVGQMLTARVTGGVSGGGEARENIGVRMLARYTKRNWDMLVPEFPMPPNSNEIGRIQVAASGQVRECQVANITGVQARELALSGTKALLPAGMPGSTIVPRSPNTNQKALPPPITPAEQSDSQETPANTTVIPPHPITVSEAISQGILKGNINTVRSWRRLDDKFPKPVDMPPGGNAMAHYYNPVELADYQESRKRK